MSQATKGERRIYPRASVDIPCLLSHGPGRPRKMRLINLSHLGALVRWDEGMDGALRPGEQVSLSCTLEGQRLRATGTIRHSSWSPMGQSIGIGKLEWFREDWTDANLDHLRSPSET